MVCFLMADGFEETEAIVPYDLLKRAGLKVVTASISGSLCVTGGHGLEICCDLLASKIEKSEMSLLVLPGGGGGTDNLDSSPVADDLIRYMMESDLPVAAICAAPSILAKRGYLDRKNAVCFPSNESQLKNAVIYKGKAVRDGNIVTAKAAGASFEFGLELIKLLLDDETAEKIKESVYY